MPPMALPGEPQEPGPGLQTSELHLTFQGLWSEEMGVREQPRPPAP